MARKRHGKETAWVRHGHGMPCVNRPLEIFRGRFPSCPHSHCQRTEIKFPARCDRYDNNWDLVKISFIVLFPSFHRWIYSLLKANFKADIYWDYQDVTTYTAVSLGAERSFQEFVSFHPTGLEEGGSMLSCLSNMTFPPADQLPYPQERQFPATTEQ